MTTLMIVEPDATGHRMILYVRLIVAEALLRGVDVILLTTNEALLHDACSAVLSEFAGRLKVATMPDLPASGGAGRIGLVRSQYRWLKAFRAGYRDVSRRQRVDFAYVPFFNNIDKVISWFGSPFGSTPFGGMVMAAKFHHRSCGILGPGAGKRDIVNEFLFRRTLKTRNLAVLTSIDEPLADFAKKAIGHAGERVRYVPDVSFIQRPAPRGAARVSLGFTADDFVILLYGSVSPRKGLAKLLKLFDSHDLPPNFRLLMMGAQSADAKNMIRDFLERRPERRNCLVVVDRFVTQIEEGQAFACADVVWLCYENFSGMSGVLIQSAQAGVPVVTAGYGLIEHYRERYMLGVRWSDFVTTEKGRECYNWSRLRKSARAMRGGGRLFAFAKAHSPEAFGRNVINAISDSQNWKFDVLQRDVSLE
ncbi:hypothetical protein I5589_13835 [Burkholderia vietnamiensis]|uniref:Glycosyl transferase family 1 domain-containing protein n=1 Tax=Burkholderia vietnamiensis TaxID=60552 RepID=A0ABS1AVH8_BURVI|nr:hypothetical protein [Burkholderia vietnamiensis]MBJ9688157.1 hypothetical protein [Burkholderia vietnamiensis]